MKCLRPRSSACIFLLFSAVFLPPIFSPVFFLSVAQERYVEIVERYARPKVFITTNALPASGAAAFTSSRIFVNIRISYDYLFFVRAGGETYKSEVSFSVELLTPQGAAGRGNARAVAYADSFSITKDRTKFLTATVDITAPNADFDMVTEILDIESGKPLRVDRRKFSVKPVTGEAVALSTPVILERADVQPTDIRLVPSNLSGNAAFGQDFLIGVALTSAAPKMPEQVYYELYEKKGDKETLLSKETVAPASLYAVDSGTLRRDTSEKLSLTVRRASNPAAATEYVALLNLNGRKLNNSKFVLKVYAVSGGKTSQTQKEFETAWIDMPYALYDLDLAVRLMEYLFTREQYGEMQSGGLEEREKKFKAYWKERDPSPDTEYNEMLAEYYRRIDYAFFNLYTAREYGWRTDRGRIYILYGEPNRIEREFPSNSATREIWTYDALKRKFTFLDRTRTGNYELVQQTPPNQ